MKNKELRNGVGLVFAGILLCTGTVLAAGFVQPTASFPNNNAVPPINESATNQIKDGDLSVNLINSYNLKGANEVCIGDDCRSVWPSGGGSDLDTFCQIETIIKAGDPHTSETNTGIGAACDSYLTSQQKQDGWITVAFDSCPGVQGRDCSGQKYCQYARLLCGEGVTFSRGDELRRTSGGSSGGSGGGGGTDGGGSEFNLQ